MNNFKKRPVSVPCGVRVIPLSGVFRFAVSGDNADIMLRDSVELFPEVPGTVTASHTVSTGIWSKKLTLTAAHVTPELSRRLSSLAASQVVAAYTDSLGHLRVCGSPEWPLTLSWTSSGGRYMVTLTGSDTCDDRFLRLC